MCHAGPTGRKAAFASIGLTAREPRWELAAVARIHPWRSLASVVSILLVAVVAEAAPLTPSQRKCQESIAHAGRALLESATAAVANCRRDASRGEPCLMRPSVSRAIDAA